MRRTLGIVAAAAVLGLGQAGTAAAWPERFEGRPEQLEVGGDSAYYIWHADDGWHLSTTGPGPRRNFRAVIRSDGEFEHVDQVRTEATDHYEVRDGGKTLIVHFTTYGHIDNIRWRLAGGEACGSRSTSTATQSGRGTSTSARRASTRRRTRSSSRADLKGERVRPGATTLCHPEPHPLSS